MRAVDTNILVRVIVNDNPDQATQARRLLHSDCFVSNTVLLETAWVLRSRYKLDRATIVTVLTNLLAGDTIHVAAPDNIRWALSAYADGSDIADLLHLVDAAGSDAFTTFDQRLQRVEGSPLPIEVVA